MVREGIRTARISAVTVAVAASFFLNGLGFASWAGRIPDVREALDLTAPQLGLLLVPLSVGSVGSLTLSGLVIHRFGPRAVVHSMSLLFGVALSIIAFGVSWWHSVPMVGAGLFLYGVATGLWDVAMNVEGAEVERLSGRPIMPRFHAAFSLGTVTGAGGAVIGAKVSHSVLPHLIPLALIITAVSVFAAGKFTLGAADEETTSGVGAAWRERRTLLIGLLVLVLALTEGTANDWLAVALEDGYGVTRPTAVLGFAGFVTAMTAGRMVGPLLLLRFGRVPTIVTTMLMSILGVLLVVFGAVPWLVIPGIVIWGVGASLGFPVGMSAAADDPVKAAARLSVVTTIGYVAFLAGPPLLGLIAGHTGTLHALLVLGFLVLVTLPLAGSLKEPAAAEA